MRPIRMSQIYFLLAGLAGRASAGHPFAFDSKPYARFMLARPISATSKDAIYVDLVNCATVVINMSDPTTIQWHKLINDDPGATKCQTFTLRRLPWIGKTFFGIGLSSFLIAGKQYGLSFGHAPTGDGMASLTVEYLDPTWQADQQFVLDCAGQGDDQHYAKSCLIRLTKPGQTEMCLSVGGDRTGEQGPLTLAACGDTADAWNIVRGGLALTQADHNAGWAP